MYKSYYAIVPLKDVFKHITNGFDFRDYQASGTPYIKVANVKPGYFDFSHLNYIDLNTNDISKKIHLKRGNLLLTRKGTFGNALSIDVDYEYIISSEIFYLELHKNIVNSKYLEIVLNSNIGQEQFDRFKIGAIMGSLSQDAIKYIKVPLPPKEIQQEVVNIYNAAYKQKQAKESEAKKLLASLDDYLLDELGITLPEQDYSLQKRIFTTNFSKLTSSRFDPKLYDLATTSLKNAITGSTYETSPLGKLIIHGCSGDWGTDEYEIGFDANLQRCLVIRATEFDNEYNLDLSNSRVKYRLINIHKLKRMDLCSDDLLIEKSGGSPNQPVGRVALIEDTMLQSNNLGYSNFIHKIRVNTALIYPAYLFCVLKMMHNIKLTDSMQSQTNGIRNLIMSNYLAQQIPLPPLEKQQKIAEHIRKIRQEAKQLQEDGANILANAKTRVEQMILGVK